MPVDSYTVAGIIRRNELETELCCPLSKRNKNKPGCRNGLPGVALLFIRLNVYEEIFCCAVLPCGGTAECPNGEIVALRGILHIHQIACIDHYRFRGGGKCICTLARQYGLICLLLGYSVELRAGLNIAVVAAYFDYAFACAHGNNYCTGIDYRAAVYAGG